MSPLDLEVASPEEAAALAELQTAVADGLTARYGRGPWSAAVTEKGVLLQMRTGKVYLARSGAEIIATLRLCTKKPWAIDPAYFSRCKRPLYLVNMAVHPAWQRKGIGRLCLAAARRAGYAWPGDAIRLDAFDAAAGAGGFYRKCGFEEVGRVAFRNIPLVYFETLL